MKQFDARERVDSRAISQVKAIAKVTGKGINVRLRIEVVGLTVYEDTVWGSAIESSRGWGPFESDDEAHAFAQQRLNWIERCVLPTVHTDQPAEPFTFVYPPP
jgi:hypothetical protein